MWLIVSVADLEIGFAIATMGGKWVKVGGGDVDVKCKHLQGMSFWERGDGS